MKKLYILLFTILITSLSFGQTTVFINEVHYDDPGGDSGEGVEIAGPAGTDLSTYTITPYNGSNGTFYSATTLSGIIPNEGGSGFGTIFFAISGLQNGAPDGIALDNSGTLIQFLSYEGTFTATNGVANGVLSIDIGFAEPGAEGESLQLTGTGTEYEDFFWTSSMASTYDLINTGQTFGAAVPTINVGSAVSGLDYFEGNGPSNEGTFTVEGVNLTANITVAAPTNFEVSLTISTGFGTSVSVIQTAGTAPTTTIYTRLMAGLLSNSYSGDVTASSTGATNQTVALSGTVSPADPQITITGTVGSLNYNDGAGPSAEDSFSVEALFLTTNLTVTAPTNFEVSLTSGGTFTPSVIIAPTSGTVAATNVFIRLASGLSVGPYSGDVTGFSTGATNQTLAVNGNVFGPLTNALVLTAVYDGPLAGGTPKGIELYALADIPDLSFFGVSSITNGAGSSAGTIEYTFPADVVSAGTYIYLATEAVQFTAFFAFAPTYTNGVVGINGDDSIELYENGQIIDTFGDVNMDGTGEPWDYLDSWAYRVDDTGPDGTTFVLGNWTFGSPNALDSESTNATATTPVPIGTYTNTVLSTDDFSTNNFKIYPNPTSLGFVNIASKNSETIQANVFDVLGKQVINTSVTNSKLDVSNLNAGVYIMRITQNNATVTKKLVIQ